MFGVGEKECGLTLHKELTVLAIKGANVSLYCPTKGGSFNSFMWKCNGDNNTNSDIV